VPISVLISQTKIVRILLAVCILLLYPAFPALAQQYGNNQHIEFQVGDTLRTAEMYMPPNLSTNAASPLVINLHSTGGRPEGQERISGMSLIADRENFILLSGMASYLRADGSRTWNADLDPDGVSDVSYILAAIEAVDAQSSVDRNRIYVTGFSGGARMASRLACELSDILAAVAPVAGVQFAKNCDPSRAIPIITFHSEDDPVNTYYTGNVDRNPSWIDGVELAISNWAESNTCSASPLDEFITQEITRLTYIDCSGQSTVVFYQLDRGGHAWPGTSSITDINASELIWEFFEEHQLP